MAKAREKSEITGKKFKDGLSKIQMDNFVLALIENNHNISKACIQAGITRKAYYYNLKYNEEFQERLNWGNNLLKNLVENGIMEGLIHSDLTLRLKYLDVLAKSGILAKVMGFENDKQQLNLVFDKDTIKLQ